MTAFGDRLVRLPLEEQLLGDVAVRVGIVGTEPDHHAGYLVIASSRFPCWRSVRPSWSWAQGLAGTQAAIATEREAYRL